MAKFYSKTLLALVVIIFPNVHCSDLGKLTCTNGAWVPDGKLITLALKCPLPLDGKSKSKGKTTHCAFKNAKLTDAKTGVTKRDQIASTVCGIFTQADKEKACKKKVQECLQKGKNYFQDPKTDKEYKSWSDPFECVEKWVKAACKK